MNYNKKDVRGSLPVGHSIGIFLFVNFLFSIEYIMCLVKGFETRGKDGEID